MHRALLSAVLSLSVLLGTLVAAQDVSYTFTPIDVPGASATLAHGINKKGQIVGYYSLPNQNAWHGFLYTAGAFTPLDVPFPGATNGTQAFGINNKGQIVGGYSFGNGEVHGFLYADGVFTPFDVPGATNTVLFAINDHGLMVGEYDVDGSSRWHGFLYADGQVTTLAVPFAGATATHPYGVNNKGQVVGNYFTDAERYHGFLYAAGVFTVIDVPGATHTQAYGINDKGQIVEVYTDQSGGYGFSLHRRPVHHAGSTQCPGYYRSRPQ
jgi:probable HAF family extracellular repeat protein